MLAFYIYLTLVILFGLWLLQTHLEMKKKEKELEAMQKESSLLFTAYMESMQQEQQALQQQEQQQEQEVKPEEPKEVMKTDPIDSRFDILDIKE